MRAAALTAALLAAAGCGAEEAGERPLPSGCTAGPEAVRAALEAAPGPVRVDGTPLSACFRPRTGGAELQALGTAVVDAAAALSDRASRRPESRSATELGYLVGAVQRGAGHVNAQGVNTELVRRVEQELALVDPDSRALRRGLRAGRRTG